MTKSQLIAVLIRSGMTREKALALAAYLRPEETWDLDGKVHDALASARLAAVAHLLPGMIEVQWVGRDSGASAPFSPNGM